MAGLPSASQDFPGGIPAWRPHDAAAPVRCRSAQKEVAHWRPVMRPSRGGTKEQQLLERQFSLEDISLCEAERPLDIQRGEDLPVKNQIPDAGGVLRDRTDDGIAERFTALVPRTFDQVI